MGLFGFGKKKSKKEAEPAVEPVDEDKVAAEAANAAAKAESAETVLAEPSSEYQGRGEERGPWDVNDEDVPDYDDYLDLGAYYLPFLQGIQLRIKANRAIQQVLGSTPGLAAAGGRSVLVLRLQLERLLCAGHRPPGGTGLSQAGL